MCGGSGIMDRKTFADRHENDDGGGSGIMYEADVEGTIDDGDDDSGGIVYEEDDDADTNIEDDIDHIRHLEAQLDLNLNAALVDDDENEGYGSEGSNTVSVASTGLSGLSAIKAMELRMNAPDSGTDGCVDDDDAWEENADGAAGLMLGKAVTVHPVYEEEEEGCHKGSDGDGGKSSSVNAEEEVLEKRGARGTGSKEVECHIEVAGRGKIGGHESADHASGEEVPASGKDWHTYRTDDDNKDDGPYQCPQFSSHRGNGETVRKERRRENQSSGTANQLLPLPCSDPLDETPTDRSMIAPPSAPSGEHDDDGDGICGFSHTNGSAFTIKRDVIVRDVGKVTAPSPEPFPVTRIQSRGLSSPLSSPYGNGHGKQSHRQNKKPSAFESRFLDRFDSLHRRSADVGSDLDELNELDVGSVGDGSDDDSYGRRNRDRNGSGADNGSDSESSHGSKSHGSHSHSNGGSVISSCSSHGSLHSLGSSMTDIDESNSNASTRDLASELTQLKKAFLHIKSKLDKERSHSEVEIEHLREDLQHLTEEKNKLRDENKKLVKIKRDQGRVIRFFKIQAEKSSIERTKLLDGRIKLLKLNREYKAALDKATKSNQRLEGKLSKLESAAERDGKRWNWMGDRGGSDQLSRLSNHGGLADLGRNLSIRHNDIGDAGESEDDGNNERGPGLLFWRRQRNGGPLTPSEKGDE